MQNCAAWLEHRLLDGEVHLCEDIRNSAEREGFSRRELKAARKVLSVKTFHQFDENGDTGNWFWYLER